MINEFCEGDRDVTLTRLPLGYPGAYCRFENPVAYLGKDAGGAVGSGPGQAVGAALALKDSGRLPGAVMGDGDFLMGVNALWTASHMELPLMIVVANNRSYFNDEAHQERVAVMRDRPPQNKWIGQRLDQPPVDIIALAVAQGFEGAEPVTDADALLAEMERGEAVVKAGGRYIIDARRTGYEGCPPGLEKRDRPHFDTFPGRRIGRACRIVKGGMRGEARPAVGRRIEDLEDQRFVARHAREIVPFVVRVIRDLIGLPHTVGITPFRYDKILFRQTARIDNAERMGFDRIADCPPDLNDGETPRQQILRLVGQQVAHPVGARPFGIIVVDACDRFAHCFFISRVFIAGAQRMIEYVDAFGAGARFHEFLGLFVINRA